MKKNIRKIPAEILAKLKSLGDEVVAGCAVQFGAEELRAGRLRHLGVELTDSGLVVPPSVVPPIAMGKYSRRNIEGHEIVRKDLPKETHYTPVETPNWGDSYYGTHTVFLPHEAYPREFVSPRESEIVMHSSNKKPGQQTYVISFRVDDVLAKNSKAFSADLLIDLNILQENIGRCGVETAQTPLATYEKSLRVDWEVLPPGSREEAIERLFRGRRATDQQREVAGERFDFFKSLNPKKLVYGRSGFSRYFGALLEDDLVVFENVEYGNALYILFKDWQELSRRSRLELLSGKVHGDFERVPHFDGWAARVREVVRSRREGKE